MVRNPSDRLVGLVAVVAVGLGVIIWLGRWLGWPSPSSLWTRPTMTSMPTATVVATATPTAPSSADPSQQPPKWTPLVRAETVPTVSDDHSKPSLRKALTHSLTYYRRRKPTDRLRFADRWVSIADYRRTVADIRDGVTKWGLSDRFYRWLEDNFVFYRSKADVITCTGYYLASLRGSKRKSKRFRYPLYRRPKDLVRTQLKTFPFFRDHPGLPSVIKGRLTTSNDVHPYWTRLEIDFEDALAGRELELIWTDDIVGLNNLHVQGSGVVTLLDGKTMQVGYADSNGHRFQGVGGYLIRQGIAPPGVRTTKQINDFLRQRPELWREVFSENPSYVFFRSLKGGAVGCLAVPVTGHRTIATDHRYFPAGAVALLECEKPVFDGQGRVTGWKKFRRLVLNQDTGGAIKGAERLDLFCGHGAKNARIAGAMKQPGALWFLVRKGARHE